MDQCGISIEIKARAYVNSCQECGRSSDDIYIPSPAGGPQLHRFPIPLTDMPIPAHFLVCGATGRQGGAVINALLEDKAADIQAKHVHALTRDASGASAQRLTSRGINIVVGDLSQPTAIFTQLENNDVDVRSTGVFLAQAHGPTELSDAKAFISAAARAGVPYFVYSSVDRGGKELSDRDASYCKTFSDKFHIEQHLKQVAGHTGMGFTILRPVWFADNDDWGFAGRLCMTGWRENMGGKKMQVVITKDIGRWAVEALVRPDCAGVRNEALSIASDYLTFEDVDRIFRDETGGPVGVTYGWLAKLMIWAVKDLNTMFAWIGEREYGADIELLNKTVLPTSFRSWVKAGVVRY